MTPRPLALSTSWNSSRHKEGDDMLKEIRDLGFTHAELGHGIRYSLWPGALKAIEQGVIKISTLHNFCPVPIGILRPSPNCFQFTDRRSNLRKAAVNATLDTVRQAAKLEVPVVVMHLGWGGPDKVTDRLETLYRRGKAAGKRYARIKVEAVEERQKLFPELFVRLKECLKPIVDEAGQLKVKLGFEIREVFEEFPHEEEMVAVLDAFPREAVGYWHDFGHSARKDFLGWHTHAETLARRAPVLLGCHVHDCRPPARDHLPLGHGEIDFRGLIPLMPQGVICVLELGPGVPEEHVIASHTLWDSYAATAA